MTLYVINLLFPQVLKCCVNFFIHVSFSITLVILSSLPTCYTKTVDKLHSQQLLHLTFHKRQQTITNDLLYITV